MVAGTSEMGSMVKAKEENGKKEQMGLCKPFEQFVS
jgi:hypothetical protein